MRRVIAMMALIALLSAGCGQSGPSNKELGWEEDWIRVGDLIGVEPMEGFSADEDIAAMGESGVMYYRTWTSGDYVSYTNENGNEAKYYDAQFYVLIQKFEDEAAAKNALGTWKNLENNAFDTEELQTETYAGQAFERMSMARGGGDDPYTHGAVALGVHGNWGILVELLCRDSFAGDPVDCLAEFISGFHYSE